MMMYISNTLGQSMFQFFFFSSLFVSLSFYLVLIVTERERNEREREMREREMREMRESLFPVILDPWCSWRNEQNGPSKPLTDEYCTHQNINRKSCPYCLYYSGNRNNRKREVYESITKERQEGDVSHEGDEGGECVWRKHLFLSTRLRKKIIKLPLTLYTA